MIYFILILWFVIGYASIAYVGYKEYNEGKDITVDRLIQFGFVGLFGPLVAIIFGVAFVWDLFDKHKNDVIFKKGG